ncbi:response regulator transcription factor [Arabiibacter massiliensis]|uniref:response regulator transcription factor n=1 Tax=Arabiibacter massiliensis TaxID=1870985 RepID=UPI00155AF550|nr:helix-turn-helix transcriptional regulator [Arabiibacter massiliensis]
MTFEGTIVLRGALVVAALLLMFCWSRIGSTSRLHVVSSLGLLAGIVGSSFLVIDSAEGSAYHFAGFAMVGLCGGLLEVKWCLYFLNLDRDALFENLLISIFLSSIIGIALFLLRPLGLFYLESLILLAAMALLERKARVQMPLSVSLFELPCPLRESSPRTAQEQVGNGEALRAKKRNGRRLAAIITASFLYSIVHIGGATLWDGVSSPDSTYLLRAVANLFTTATLFIVFLARGTESPNGLLRTTLLLTTAGLLMQMPFMDGLGAAAFFVFCCGNKLFDILIWVLIVETLDALPAFAGKGFGAAVASKNGGCLVGSFMSQAAVNAAASGNPSSPVVFISLLVLLLMVTLLWILSERMSYAIPSKSQLPEAYPPNTSEGRREDSLHRAAMAIASEKGLTSRETEVFLLMARGKNRAAIAKELGISKNTVHTHIIHIYQKTGITEQQELISLIERLVD